MVPGLHQQPPSRPFTRSIAAFILLGACVSGCAASAASAPNTAGNATAVPGSIPGIDSSGDITISGLSVHRSGNQLAITAQIRNTGSSPDALLSLSSQVSATLTESPALTIAAKGTTTLGAGGSQTSLTINARLEPGGSVALVLNFRDAGQVDAYSTFTY